MINKAIPVLIMLALIITLLSIIILNQVYDLVYASDEIKILSSSKYIDSVNYTHVVGEVQNISPSMAEHIRVSATFYDDQGTVVGTVYTYTSSDNVTSGSKVPFEIILIGASVPMNKIYNYSLVSDIN